MIIRVLLFASVLWFGVMAGFFGSFSVVVMPGLDGADPAAAVSAMQNVNIAVRNPIFGGAFFGAALIAVALLALPFARPRSSSARRIIPACAGLLYLTGVMGVTTAGNLPLNEALALVDPSSPSAGAAMDAFSGRWTDLNHIRALSALAAVALMAWESSKQGIWTTGRG